MSFINRLQDERDELVTKVGNLEKFMNGDNLIKLEDQVQIPLLKIQLQAMKTYLECLEQRINRLHNKLYNMVKTDNG